MPAIKAGCLTTSEIWDSVSLSSLMSIIWPEASDRWNHTQMNQTLYVHHTRGDDVWVKSYLTERRWHRSWPLLQHRCWLPPPHCSGFPVPDWKWAQSRWSRRPTGLRDSDSRYPDTRSVKRRRGRDGMTVIAWGTHSAAQEAQSASQR